MKKWFFMNCSSSYVREGFALNIEATILGQFLGFRDLLENGFNNSLKLLTIKLYNILNDYIHTRIDLELLFFLIVFNVGKN